MNPVVWRKVETQMKNDGASWQHRRRSVERVGGIDYNTWLAASSTQAHERALGCSIFNILLLLLLLLLATAYTSTPFKLGKYN